MAIVRHLAAVSFLRFRRSERGSSMIEFALGAPVLFLLAAGTIELGMILFVNVLMESGLRDASRFGITGQVPAGQSRLERILEIVEDRTIGLVDMNEVEVRILVYPSFADIGRGEGFVDGNGNGTYDAGETFDDENGNGAWDADVGAAGVGGSGDIVVYRMRYDWNLLTPLAKPLIGSGGKFTLRTAVAVRNEPWEN
jgi:hypothetical protein